MLLLDGIDEAIKSAPWILEKIREFAQTFPAVQVVTSSRVSGTYVAELPFFSIRLLPFRTEQRDAFIASWFANTPGDDSLRIQAHLEQNHEVAEITKSPLLATVLCILQEASVPLPETELRLYQERMNLLLGAYDTQRGFRRLTSLREDLWLAARKIAFWLHQQGLRDAPIETLERCVVDTDAPEARQRRLRDAVGELADPCNVLVPMTDDGMLGFGHLRYQEYMVARHFHENRALSLRSYLTQEWWRGPIYLFAQMCDSVDWLLDLAKKESAVPTASETLRQVFENRAPTEGGHLLALLEEELEFLGARERASFKRLGRGPSLDEM